MVRNRCSPRRHNNTDVLFTNNGTDDNPCNRSSDSGRRQPRTRQRLECGNCSTKCVYMSLEMFFFIGIAANILVIHRVICDRKLRNPTFVAIAALAFADLLFLSMNLSISLETLVMIFQCYYPSKLKSRAYFIIKNICWFAANAHVAMLAGLRYATLLNPLKALFMTSKRVLMMSGLMWLVGLLFIGTLSLLINFEVIMPRRSEEFVIYLWTVVYFLPLVVTAVLHIVKVRMVKRLTQETATSSTQKFVRRMSKIVIMVIVCAAILPLPRLLNNILRLHGRSVYPSKEFRIHFTNIAHMLFLLNNCINPFVYAFMSKQFRNSFKGIFRCVLNVGDNSEVTAETPDTPRRVHTSIKPVDTSESDIASLDDKL